MPQGGTGEHVTSSSTSKSSNYLMQLLSVFEDFLWVSNTFTDFQVTPDECKLGCGWGNQAEFSGTPLSAHAVTDGTATSGTVTTSKCFAELGLKHSYLNSISHDWCCSNVTFYSLQLNKRWASAPPTAAAATSAASTPTGSTWAQDCVSAIDELICIFHSTLFDLCKYWFFLEGGRISEAQELSVSTHSCPPVQMGNTPEPRCHQHECWQLVTKSRCGWCRHSDRYEYNSSLLMRDIASCCCHHLKLW